MKRYWICMALIIACVLFLNLFSIPHGDELSGAFRLLSTPMEGSCQRISSFSGLVASVYDEYFHGSNGRSWLALICCSVAIFKVYVFYRLLNTGMFFLFVYLLLKEGNVARITCRNLCIGSLLVFLFQWYADCFNAGAHIGIAYLWMMCATLAVVRAWRHSSSWWLPVFAFFYGWGQEGFTLPTLVALVGYSVLLCWRNRSFALNRYQVTSLGTMFVGALFLCCAPGVLHRGGGMVSKGGMALMLGFARNVASLALSLWPMVLILLAVFCVWKERRRILEFDGLEWALLFGASLGLLILLGQTPGVGPERLSLPVTSSCMVVILRHRQKLLSSWLRIKGLLLTFSLLLLIGSAIMQTFSGMDMLRALRDYRTNPQRITYRRNIIPGPLAYAVDMSTLCRWHRMLFRREFELDKDPVFLTRYLYDSLYKDPQKFFQDNKLLPGSRILYVSEHLPHALVKKGGGILPQYERTLLERYLNAAYAKPTGWRRCIPGRFRLWFPAEDFVLGLPRNEFSFTACNGEEYTIFTRQ